MKPTLSFLGLLLWSFRFALLAVIGIPWLSGPPTPRFPATKGRDLSVSGARYGVRPPATRARCSTLPECPCCGRTSSRERTSTARRPVPTTATCRLSIRLPHSTSRAGSTTRISALLLRAARTELATKGACRCRFPSAIGSCGGTVKYLRFQTDPAAGCQDTTKGFTTDVGSPSNRRPFSIGVVGTTYRSATRRPRSR